MIPAIDPDADVEVAPRVERHNIGTAESYDADADRYAALYPRVAEFCRERAASIRGIPWVPVAPC